MGKGNDHRGRKNSSITRVRPFFRQLLRADASLLGKLLLCATQNVEFAAGLAARSLAVNPPLKRTRKYKDRILVHYGHKTIDLENCFEWRSAPPHNFLHWLIEHSDILVWPKKGNAEKTYSRQTQDFRERLVGRKGSQAMHCARETALSELKKFGAKGSARKKWAFEGFTEVDCYLETPEIILFVEGKRTEPLSPSTDWYPARNQLIRNLEAAQAHAQSLGKEYAVVLMSEEREDILPRNATASLPHFSVDQRTEIMEHYLGCILWRDACIATGIPYSSLPDATDEAQANGASGK